jgi:hypothetical protein
MSDLAQLLDANLSQGTTQLVLEEETIDLSRLGREQISELAEAMAGVGRKGSPTAYRSARRQLERWRKGGVTPRLRSRERLRGARRQATARLTAFRARGADMRIYMVWGSAASARRKRRGEWLPPHEWIQIARTVMRRVIREWAQGELEEAADLLFVEFLQSYGIDNAEDFMEGAEVLELLLEPRD